MDGAEVGVRWIATLLVTLGVGATLATVTADGAVAHTAGVDPLDFAPIVSSVLTHPTPVKAMDGRFHIVYEVLLTNNQPYTLAVEGFEVRDARTRRVLARLAGPALAANMGPLAGPPESDPDDAPSNLNPAAGLSEQAASDAATTMPASQTLVVWLDLQVRSPRPRSLEHFVVASSRPPPGPQFSSSGLIGRVQTGGTPVEIGPPVGRGLWVADEGCCINPTHHRPRAARLRRRAAGRQPLRDRLGPGRPQSPRVDRRPDPAVQLPQLSAAAHRRGLRPCGGHPRRRAHQPAPRGPDGVSADQGLRRHWVSIRIAPRRYLLYAHLVPGSVRVRAGQPVRS